MLAIHGAKDCVEVGQDAERSGKEATQRRQLVIMGLGQSGHLLKLIRFQSHCVSLRCGY